MNLSKRMVVALALSSLVVPIAMAKARGISRHHSGMHEGPVKVKSPKLETERRSTRPATPGRKKSSKSGRKGGGSGAMPTAE